MSRKVILEGSHKAAPPTECTHNINADETSEVTVRIRRKKSIDDLLATGQQISREEYEDEYGASQEDIDAVVAFASEHHLTVKHTDLGRRTIEFTGKLSDLQSAFDVKLDGYTDANGNQYRGRSGAIYIPENLEGIIEGVFGLDNRPLARPMFKFARHDDGGLVSHAQSPASFTPDKLAEVYGFPEGDGSGECIGIIELGGGYKPADLKTYFSGLGIKEPEVTSVSVDKGKNAPTTPDSADGEVMLDIEVAGAVAPAAKIVVYFTTNTDKGFLDSITTAINDKTNKPSVISISWGSAESAWTQQSLDSFNEAFKSAAVMGVTICVASGDSGSDDSVGDGNAHVDFPASSPYVLACGGTKLTVAGDGSLTEVVWHESNDSAGGGGVSEYFALPDYQNNAGVPPSINNGFQGRGVPDVAGDADPDTGYNVLVDGQQMVIGGTSAVAPLMAGFIARVNQISGSKAGFINPKIYADPSGCRDITEGNNITTTTGKGYSAGPGWDACTGLGVLSKLPSTDSTSGTQA